MNMFSVEKQELLAAIVELEWDMMQRVRAASPSLCQQQPDTFTSMRWMSHSVLSEQTLASYLGDLRAAATSGRNLITEKYARMDELIPPLSAHPAIGDILRAESAWMTELSQRFPRLFPGPLESFQRYARAELETLSDQTLAAYLRDVSRAAAESRNLVEERYRNLFRRIGLGSLEEEEARRHGVEGA